MKPSRFFTFIVVSLSFVITSTLHAQGFYWESTMSGGPGGERVSKNYMMPHLFKVEEGSDKHTSMIVNTDKKILLTMNDADKTYSETTFDEMEARMKKMSGESDAKIEALKERLKAMPAEQRKMMEKMMGQSEGASEAIEIKNTGEKKTILGYECVKMEVRQEGETVLSVWASSAVKGFDKLKGDWEEFSRRMTPQMPGKMGKAIVEGMKKIEGFPMQTEIGTIVSTITKLEPRAIPASVFDVPAKYKKIKEPMFETKEE